MTDDSPGRTDLLGTPIRMVDVSGKKTVSELVKEFSSASFQARKISQCVDIYMKMAEKDRSHTIFLGMSGALIAAGMRKIISDLVRMGLVDVLVTTGAVIYQDLYQASGYEHFKGDPSSDNALLHSLMIDRIHDTYVDEEMFRKIDIEIGHLVDVLEPRQHSTREFLSILGERCQNDEDSILGNASRMGIPIYCPAIADSSIGIGLSTAYMRQRRSGREMGEIFNLDTIRDNYEIAQIVHRSASTGAIYLGGGVPKNYINDAIVMADILFGNQKGHEYAFQITMDRPEWGGLSGSTLDEARSWGKIHAEATHATVNVELSVALPLIAGAVMERRDGRKRTGPHFEWEDDRLVSA